MNQGSRIEGMTRQFGVGVCIDETTANFVRRLMPPEQGRYRRLARVRPKGMETPLLIHELLPPETEGDKVTETTRLNYEAALEAIISGRWGEGLERLDAVPDEDGPRQFLIAQMAKHNNTPPPIGMVHSAWTRSDADVVRSTTLPTATRRNRIASTEPGKVTPRKGTSRIW